MRWLVIPSCLLLSGMGIASVLPAPQDDMHYHQAALANNEQALPKPSRTHVPKDPYAIYNLVRRDWIPQQFLPLQAKAIFNTNFHPAGFSLPAPLSSHMGAKLLTLRDAILLALRFNPDIKNSELTRVTDKYAVLVAKNQFEPQYSLSLTGTYNYGNGPTYALTPGIQLKDSIGTTFSVNQTNGLNGGAGTTTLEIKQPLLQGFGAVNLINYENALDTEQSARLTFKSDVITNVVSVIQDYRNLVGDYNNLKIQKHTLNESIETVRQSKLKVAAGKAARSDLLQQEANEETNRLSYVQQQNTVETSYQTLLQAIGLVPSARVKIDQNIDTRHAKVLSLKKCISLALKGNIDYQQQLIQLRSTERQVVSAKDKRKWQLDVTGQTSFGDTRTNGALTSASAGPQLQFDLNIPIDDISSKSDLVSAEIDLEKAKINLQKAKQTLIQQIYTQWTQIQNEKQQLAIAKRQVTLQEQALKDVRIRQNFGKATVFEVNQIQDQLLSQQTSYVSTKISYLNDITTLYQDLGLTLNIWDIKLRY